MNKKDLKWYESPVLETVNVEVESQILAGSPAGGGSDDITPDEGFGG
ncbi:MAG: hypothetical protein IJ618_00780 [Prevotella sp.]|nr:hypothetical protein [Prevotella sp.]